MADTSGGKNFKLIQIWSKLKAQKFIIKKKGK